MSDEDSIDTLRNLGPKSAGWLRESGVATVGDLRRLGPVVAYLLVKEQRPRASLNLLWALAAGLDGRDWRDLSGAARSRLRREVDAVRPAGPTTGRLTMTRMEWYDALAKPSWTPDGGTIGLIWSLLYPVIVVSFGYVFVQSVRGKIPRAVAVPFAINLVANLVFTPIQFGLRNLPLAASAYSPLGKEPPQSGVHLPVWSLQYFPICVKSQVLVPGRFASIGGGSR